MPLHHLLMRVTNHTTAPGALQNARTFRMDIELGRLEFLVHPNMAREDVLVRGE